MTDKEKIPTKQRILEAATELFHQKSYGEVTLYNVADAINLKQGHVYYHFKTLRDLGLAVLHCHHDEVKSMLNILSKASSPRERLIAFLNLSNTIEDYYMHWGCPIASLTDALIRESKTSKERKEVPLIYQTQIEWFQDNFEELGIEKTNAYRKAQTIMSNLQGSIHMGYVLGKPEIFKNFIKTEIQGIKKMK